MDFTWLNVAGDFSSLVMQQFIAILAVTSEPSFLTVLGDRLWIIGSVALGLGFVVFVHELGHFLAAKTFGVRCDKFYVGFDVPISLGPIKLPASLGKFQWGETEYGIGIIPLGGYVKMLGQDDDPRKMEEETASAVAEDGELDPRSYLAKPVWQRMIIISAGVIMNLIFAVIMAGVAYSVGVPYTPTLVGSTSGGGPAWQQGLETGDRILRAGDMKEEETKLRYDDFAMSVVTHGFAHSGDSMKVVYSRDGQKSEVEVTPTTRYHPEGFYFIGVSSPLTPVMGRPSVMERSFLANTPPDLEPGDTIVAVNGKRFEPLEDFGKILGTDATAEFQANWEDPIQVTVSRPGESPEAAETEHEVTLPAVPLKTLGLGFEVGPINSLRANSPAMKAGFKAGDRITKINDQPVVDALTLPSLVGRLAGQEIRVEVARNDNDSTLETLTVQSLDQARFDSISPFSGELTLAGLGIAYDALPVVSSINTELVSGDVEVGDKLEQIRWVASKEDRKDLADLFREEAFDAMAIDEQFTVACLHDLLQNIPAGAEISCIFSRSGQMQSPVSTAVTYSDEWFWHERGVILTALKTNWIANNAGEAIQLGFWETSRRFKSVLNFLKLLVTGKVSPNKLGGPLKIAYAAGSEASNGLSRLLLFLTMLSANLAILNFLPIPALDGGHMMFLTFEAIWGKPMNEAIQMRLTVVGFLCLLSLMAFVLFKDIMWAVN